MTSKVSVIIPAYNCDRYISQAVESVLAQTYTNYEIIIVDDGSTDNTRQVLEPYLDKIRYIYQTNQGVAVTRDRGLQLAQGEFIAYLDQDDFFLPDKLASQVACLEANPDLGLVNSSWQIVSEQGQKIGSIQPWRTMSALDLSGWVLWKPVFLGAIMFRRHWLEKSGGFKAKLHHAYDVDLLLRLALMGCQAAWVCQDTVCYRQHSSNASLDASAQVKELEIVLDSFFQQPDLPLEVKKIESQSRYQSLVWSAWRLYHTGQITAMANYLEKSLLYSHNSPTENVLSWIQTFKTCAAEYGYELDTYTLSNLPEWKNLMEKKILI